jgi:hypothetical protein
MVVNNTTDKGSGALDSRHGLGVVDAHTNRDFKGLNVIYVNALNHESMNFIENQGYRFFFDTDCRGSLTFLVEFVRMMGLWLSFRLQSLVLILVL